MRLRVLLIEDSVADAILLERKLVRGGYEPVIERVESAPALRAALAGAAWDVVVSDFMLPGWNGMDALRIVREIFDDLPFILVSGAVGEETAVEAIKNGASDYLLKDRLTRLPTAVAHALEEAELRRERRRSRLSVAFLARASVRLNASLDAATVASTLVDVVVPEIADAAAVDLVDDASRTYRAAASERADELLNTAALGRSAAASGGSAAAPGRAEGAAAAGAPEVATATLPLTLRGALRGVLHLAVEGRTRAFGVVDAALGEDLATRAALALENARLHRQAREAIAARDEFLMIAAHELKTPLTPLSLQVQTLLRASRGAPATAEPRLGADLEQTFAHVERLTRLVDQLLDVSRLGADGLALDRQPFDLSEVVRAAAEGARPQASDAGCRLDVEVAGPIRGAWDRARIEQLLANLLSNAFKFGAGKPVGLTLSTVGNCARLQIRDHGHGVAPADRDRIFERFERAVSVRRYGGFGLGLWVARQIVEAHGGAITVGTPAETGATFTVDLPAGR